MTGIPAAEKDILPGVTDIPAGEKDVLFRITDIPAARKDILPGVTDIPAGQKDILSPSRTALPTIYGRMPPSEVRISLRTCAMSASVIAESRRSMVIAGTHTADLGT